MFTKSAISLWCVLTWSTTTSVMIWMWLPFKLVWLPYIGNFSRREILAKMRLGRCVKFFTESYFCYFKDSQWRSIVGFIFRCVYFWRFQGGCKLSENLTHAKNSRYMVLEYFVETWRWPVWDLSLPGGGDLFIFGLQFFSDLSLILINCHIACHIQQCFWRCCLSHATKLLKVF